MTKFANLKLVLVGALALTACDRPPPPPKPPSAQAVAAPSEPEPPPPTVVATEPPLTLPAGQTLGDALPQLPQLPRRLASGAQAGTLVPQTSCADQLPADCALGKRLEITLPPEKPGEPPVVGEVCLCTKAVDRADADRARATGKQLVVVAAWPGERKAEAAFAEAHHEPETLPPERQKAGHDGAAWGTLVATGWPAMPVVAIASARFADGQFGEVVAWQRTAQALHVDGGKLSWQPLAERAFLSHDLGQLQALCEGKADAAPADREAPNAAACARAEEAAQQLASGATERQALRQKRLKGQGAESAEKDADPQSIWLREAKKQLKAGQWQAAIQTALRVDMVCGEAVQDAHALVVDALAEGHVALAKVSPNQPLAELCEPLPDKAAPKRQRVEAEKPAKPEPATKASKGAKAAKRRHGHKP